MRTIKQSQRILVVPAKLYGKLW